jgi:Holliday junction resolvase RusA-like endonuclease
MKITLYDTPPSLNQWGGMNRYAKARLKAQWEKDIYYGAFGQRPREPMRLARVRITIFFPVKRRRDKDNYSPKFILDGLVKARIIEDDRDEVIGQPEICFSSATKPRTEIEVIDRIQEARELVEDDR